MTAAGIKSVFALGDKTPTVYDLWTNKSYGSVLRVALAFKSLDDLELLLQKLEKTGINQVQRNLLSK